MTWVKRVSSVALLVACAASAGACGSDGVPTAPSIAQSGPGAAADCTAQVDYDGQRYTGRGFTRREPVRFGRVVNLPCVDTADIDPSDLPVDYAQAFRFKGYDTRDVLAMSVDDQYLVMVADSVSRSRASRILRSLDAR